MAESEAEDQPRRCLLGNLVEVEAGKLWLGSGGWEEEVCGEGEKGRPHYIPVESFHTCVSVAVCQLLAVVSPTGESTVAKDWQNKVWRIVRL